MKKILFVLSFTLIVAPLVAQVTMSGNAVASVQFSDVNGRLIPANGNGVKGSPYVFEKFGMGKVYMADGVEAIDSNLNFSYFDQKLYFLKDNNMYVVNKPFKMFLLNQVLDNTSVEKYFANGFPAIEQNTLATFYEVIAKGLTVQLLKFRKAVIKESTPYGSAPVKEYSNDDQYYIFDASFKQMQALGGSVTLKKLKTVLPHYASQLDALSTQLRLNLKREADAKLLIEKLN